MSYGVLFNATDLENLVPALKIVGRPDIHQIPKTTLEMYALARLDASKFVGINYPQRKITIDMVLSGNNAANMEQNLDTLKGYLSAQDANLDIPYANDVRRFVATLENIMVAANTGSFLPFSAEFGCSDPVGRSTTSTSISLSSITSASSTQGITIGGTYRALPVWTITVTAVTGGTTKAITFGNPTTGQTVTITRTWSNGDVVVIDCYARTVTVNGTAANFTGAIPYWDTTNVAAQTASYVDTFSTRTVAITAAYNKRYL